MLKGQEKGVSLVEVMVTILVIGIGLLGLLGLQAKSLSGHKDSLDRKTAAELIAVIAEKMRANHLGYMADQYSLNVPINAPTPAIASCGSSGGPCTSSQLAQSDLTTWINNVRARLPESGAIIATSPPGATMTGTGTSVRVNLFWREAKAAQFPDDACTPLGITDPLIRCLAAEVFP